MGTTLQHGIFLPAEGERNCYAGLASNWTILDGVVGGYSAHAANTTIHVTAEDKAKWDAVTGKADASALTAHTGNTTIHVTAEDKAAWNGKADASALTAHTGNTTIHVTAEDKAAWNGKADASALTAHTGDTTIHVTAADKEAWNGKADASALTAHTGDTTIHVTAADKNKWDAVTTKANDADAVHKSGAETIGGIKTFTSDLFIYNSDTTAYASYLNLKNQKNARGSSATGSQGLQYQDKNNKTLTMLESRVVSNGNTVFNIVCYNIDGNNQPVSDGVSVIKSSTTTNFAPTTDNAVTSGRTLAKWSDVQTYKVNTLEPSSLSLPSDRSARVDISSYFTNTETGQSNSYTVPANGYIYLTLSELTNIHCFSRTSGNITNYAQTFTKLSNSTGTLYVLFPVRKNDVFVATWYTTTTVSVDGAFFIPCQGNI